MSKLLFEMLVYHQDYLVNCRDNALEQGDRPLFESLSHNSVICVAACLGNDVECLLEGHSLLEHEYSYKLGDSDSRVSIVQLDSIALCKFREIAAVSFLVLSYYILDRCGNEEILLLQS